MIRTLPGFGSVWKETEAGSLKEKYIAQQTLDKVKQVKRIENFVIKANANLIEKYSSIYCCAKAVELLL